MFNKVTVANFLRGRAFPITVVILALVSCVAVFIAASNMWHAANSAKKAKIMFEHYEQRHEQVIVELTDVAKGLKELYKTRDEVYAKRVFVAILTELKRLKREQTLVDSWRKSDKRESFQSVMADSLLVLEYISILGAYGNSILAYHRGNPTDEILEQEILLEAARDLDSFYSYDKKSWVFNDKSICAASRFCDALVPAATKLFDKGPDVASYRVQFFDTYVANIVRNNSGYLKTVIQAGSRGIASE